MVYKTELIEQIAEYTGKEHAEEWYRAIFEPDAESLRETVLGYVERINKVRLYRIIKQYSWKKEEAPAIFREIVDCILEDWGIDSFFYPDICLYLIRGDNHMFAFRADPKTSQVFANKLHLDLYGMIQETPSAHCIIGKISHELVHLSQSIIMYDWLKTHPCWHEEKPFNSFLASDKPGHLLYLLNQKAYVRPGDEMYSDQIIEREADGVEWCLQESLRQLWCLLNRKGNEIPAMY